MIQNYLSKKSKGKHTKIGKYYESNCKEGENT